MYGDLSKERLETSVILAGSNRTCLAVNNLINSKLPGVARTYLAQTKYVQAESAPPQAGAAERAASRPDGGFDPIQEQLDGIEVGGLPPHRLTLKKGSIVMLLKNFNKRQGLCNGTRMRVVGLHR